MRDAYCAILPDAGLDGNGLAKNPSVNQKSGSGKTGTAQKIRFFPYSSPPYGANTTAAWLILFNNPVTLDCITLKYGLG